MICPRCNAQLDNEATFCGFCGNQLAPVQAQGTTIVEQEPGAGRGRPNYMQQGHNTPTYLAQQVGSEWSASHPPHGPGPGPSTPSFATRLPHLHGRQIAFLAIILVLLVGAVSAGITALLAQRGQTASTGNAPITARSLTGTVSFSDSQDGHGTTNALNINVSGLQPPPSGTQYSAWIVNEQNENTLALGTLHPSGSTFILSFSGQNTNLVGAGNKVIVTQEQGNVTAPTGKVLLTGRFPPLAFVHLRHLLFSFPTTPGNVGLLVGLREQARQLTTQATLLNSAFNSGNTVGVLCAAQSTLNLVEGKQGAHTHLLPSVCAHLNVTVANDGFGLLGQGGSGYIAATSAHASLAAQQPDATQTIKLHAGHVIIATDNLKGWATTIDRDALALLSDSTDNTKVQEIITLADHVLNGVDLDHDEHVDPVPGEAGTTTAYIHGQLMAQLTLQP